jgi:hypothetical protein
MSKSPAVIEIIQYYAIKIYDKPEIIDKINAKSS